MGFTEYAKITVACIGCPVDVILIYVLSEYRPTITAESWEEMRFSPKDYNVLGGPPTL